MANMKVGKNKYWYKNFRMSKSTDKKLRAAKKKINKTWDGTFLELLEAYNQKNTEQTFAKRRNYKAKITNL